MATGKITRFPIVLVGSAYWSGLISWLRQTVQEEGKIYGAELDLFTIADGPDEVVAPADFSDKKGSAAEDAITPRLEIAIG